MSIFTVDNNDDNDSDYQNKVIWTKYYHNFCMMGTPKKTSKKKEPSKGTGAKKPGDLSNSQRPQKRILDDDDDFDEPLDDLDGYESFDYDDDDDDY